MTLKIVEFNKKKILDTDLAVQLYEKLINIYDNDMWALAILEELYHQEAKIKKMMDIIDSGETDTNELSLLSEEI